MFVRSVRMSTLKFASIAALAFLAIAALILFIPSYESPAPAAKIESAGEEIRFDRIRSAGDRVQFQADILAVARAEAGEDEDGNVIDAPADAAADDDAAEQEDAE